MAKLKIVKMGDDILRKTCRPVEQITPRTLTLLDDMIETMREANGCGLAAPQVGILRRIAVVETEPGEVYELINPKIIAYSGEQEGTEGCLSVPGRFGLVKRPQHITVRAMDRNGEERDITVHDFTARAFCHEIDHLDGHLYVEKVTRMLDEEEL
jgi:peptide deformylase